MYFPLLRCGERGVRGCPAHWLCKGAQQRLAGRLLPLSCWKIKEILFCFGMNPSGFEVLGRICWPGKAFSFSLSLPEFQSRGIGINPRRGLLYGHGQGEQTQGALAQAAALSSCAGDRRDQGGRRGRNTLKRRERENLGRIPVCLHTCAALHSLLSCPFCCSMGEISGETGQMSMSKDLPRVCPCRGRQRNERHPDLSPEQDPPSRCQRALAVMAQRGPGSFSLSAMLLLFP